ncbi:MAG: putative 2OG-Fe(II) oxygenase [Proteobacteria bacterium]|nr:putative 2OG-Fe(II) oxygenase [Pseudomonadota bacterium]
MSNRQQRRLQEKSLKKQKRGAAASPLVTPENIAQSMQAAASFFECGQNRQAEVLCKQVLEIEPQNVGAITALGTIAFTARRLDQARAYTEQAISLGAREAGNFMNLGAICDEQGAIAEAEAAYKQAIEINPRYGDAYYNLGNLYLKDGRPPDAIAIFDACMTACGREFHALAYKAHALLDAGETEASQRLLDFDQYVKPYRFDAPEGFDSIEAFNASMSRYIKTHPTLQGEVRSTRKGKHTGELIKQPLGPMEGMVARIEEAIRWYKAQLPDDPDHPAVHWAPERWRLTGWGVVMMNGGHEIAHIHPNGWLSGVFYVNLPEIIGQRGHQGFLEFGKPTPELNVQSKMERRYYQPEYGQMFLFPSYFYHGTVPFKSDERRICVAFDVEPIA